MHALPAELSATAPRERVLEAPELEARTLLAIDTALGTSIALGHHGRVHEVSSDDPRGHAEVIGTLLARVFALAECSPSAVTGVVAGIGPGPFTGLRVGIAAAHAFAAGRGVPLLPLQGHEAVALALLEQGAYEYDAREHGADPALRESSSDSVPRDPAADPVLRVVQDAKRRELFVTEYAGRSLAGLPQRRADPRLERRDDLAAHAGDAWPERIPAARLVQLAARRLAAALPFEPDRALYLRAPDVQPAAAVKRVSA